MKNRLLTLVYFVTVAATTDAQTPRTTSSINARLNSHLRTIDGDLSLNYINHSPDTLFAIWFHLWPNAFRNDRTAFSEARLRQNRSTDFYFAPPELRGYINRLDFRVNGNTLQMREHPQFGDVIQLLLNRPLPPGDSITIQTPFHVKIPYRFDQFGYDDAGIFLKHWYPAPAPYRQNVSGKWNWIIAPFRGDSTAPPPPQNFQVILTTSPYTTMQTNAVITDSAKSDTSIVWQMTSQNVSDIYIRLPGKKTATNISPAFTKENFVCRFLPRLLSHRVLPAIGYNEYDGLQAGVLFQNKNREKARLSYFAAALYAFQSRRVTGLGDVFYGFSRLSAGLSVSSFSILEGADSNGRKFSAGMFKVSPYIKYYLPSADPEIEKQIEYRLYVIGEQGLDYRPFGANQFYAAKRTMKTRYLNQVTFSIESSRVLYPYLAQVQWQQAEHFYRLNATGKYYFNYPKGGGLRLRLFAATFGYLSNPTSTEKFNSERYLPKLTAVRGDEDYTYGNYFIARNNFTGFQQQIMMRDGGLKLRTDMFDGLQGRSEKWIASANISTTLPRITPFPLPLRLFADAGTYSEAWERERNQPRFLYVAGLQLSLLNDLVQVYAPLVYSGFFGDQLKTVPEENTFVKRISFSINLQHADIKKALCKKPLL